MATLTTGWGAPVADNQNSLTIGPDGPVLLQDVHLLDKLAHFDRERIPERVVHAKGAGAHGYFEVTADVTKFTKAKFLNKVGKRTPVFLRFSTVGGEKGSSDLARDPRGFALKHYTEEGIYDMVGNNTPIFFIRDAIKFPDFIHTQKRDPETNLPNPNMFWDFPSLVPESVHQFMFLMGPRGLPANYRQMNGYSSHTYKWVNAAGDAFWVKLHYKTDAGIKNLTADEAKAIGDPDHATRDLFEHIASGKAASWTAYVQIMPVAEARTYKWNVFDITKVWPQKDYPLIKYGKLALNRNPTNYFAEVEQAAFSPAHLVPGIEPSPDRMLQGRLFSYSDTHRHRLGPNYLQIPINCPWSSRVAHQQRDGLMAINGNFAAAPNYEPSTAPGVAKADHTTAIKKFWVDDWVGHYTPSHPNSDFEQPGNFWRKVLTESEREQLVGNIVSTLRFARKDIQGRLIDIYSKVDKDFGRRVAEALMKHSARL